MSPLHVCLIVLILPIPAGAQEMVIAKDGTTLYHRPGCPIVRTGQGVLAMTRGQAEARGLKPDDACDPAKMPLEPASVLSPGNAPRTAPARPPASPDVLVDAAGKYYHRASCKVLGRDQKKIALNEAAKTHWPCTVCRPPIRKRKGSP